MSKTNIPAGFNQLTTDLQRADRQAGGASYRSNLSGLTEGDPIWSNPGQPGVDYQELYYSGWRIDETPLYEEAAFTAPAQSPPYTTFINVHRKPAANLIVPVTGERAARLQWRNLDLDNLQSFPPNFSPKTGQGGIYAPAVLLAKHFEIFQQNKQAVSSSGNQLQAIVVYPPITTQTQKVFHNQPKKPAHRSALSFLKGYG